MKIRPIRPEHITNCIYCKNEGDKVQAKYHLTGANKQSCEFHKFRLEALRDDEKPQERYSEADYQTWMRL